jgi:glycosyltransferase involved in cell wall biosynthesis
MKPPRSVAVVICTHLHERLDQMAEAVASITGQTRRVEELVVVVDGGPALHDAVRTRVPGVRVLGMPGRSGLAAARNAGVAAVTSDVVMFLDDDAVAAGDWVEQLFEVLCEPDVLGASGRSLPLWGAAQPSWLPDQFLWTIGCSYAGQPEKRQQVRNVYGGCSALRRELFTELSGYDSRLGYSATSAGGGEEAELCLRASRRWPTGTFVYEPAAAILHRVPGERLTRRYVLRRALAEGKAKATVSDLSDGGLSPEKQFAAELPRELVRQLRSGVRGDVASLSRATGLASVSVAVVVGLVLGQLRRPAPVGAGAPARPEAVTATEAAPALPSTGRMAA